MQTYVQVPFDLPDSKTYVDCWTVSFEFLNISLNQYYDWSCAYSSIGVFAKFVGSKAIDYTSGDTKEEYRNIPFRLIIIYK